jgi:hypothetical protein
VWTLLLLRRRATQHLSSTETDILTRVVLHVQEQRLDSEEVNTARQERAAQVIKDLSEEIGRMKAAEQRKQDAFTSLAHLLSTVKHVTDQIADVRRWHSCLFFAGQCTLSTFWYQRCIPANGAFLSVLVISEFDLGLGHVCNDVLCIVLRTAQLN